MVSSRKFDLTDPEGGRPQSFKDLDAAAKEFEKLNLMSQSAMAEIAKVAIPRPIIPDLPRLEVPRLENLASDFYERLAKWIEDFDKSLDDQHEVGVRLVSFGQSVTFHLEDMGYWNPALISFRGKTAQGEPVELVQHVSQISVLLLKLERLDISKPKRPIGFCMPEDDCTQQA